MGWWIYGTGCLVSFIIQMLMARKYWVNSSTTEKVLTVLFWYPFTTAISWFGVLLFFGCALTHFNELKGDE